MYTLHHIVPLEFKYSNPKAKAMVRLSSDYSCSKPSNETEPTGPVGEGVLLQGTELLDDTAYNKY